MVVAVVVAAAAVAVAVAVVTFSRAAVPTAEQVIDERPGPVLLVPGYGGSTASLRTIADRLVSEGRDTTVVDLPGDGTGDLNAAADALGVAANAALARTGADDVDVVGYSAGGVVARLWVADGGEDIARRIVTIGSPHHGTTLADLAGSVAPEQCPIGCQQLATTSDLLARLNTGDETPDGPSWVSIWTSEDRTVTPPESARLDGALDLPVQSVCPQAAIGHGDLPHAPVVVEMVVAQLAAGDPVALDADDCARLGG